MLALRLGYMELFKNTDYDFLGKKWPFIILSLILTAAGLISLALKGGPRYGIDFKGGALITVAFAQRPPVDKVRAALDAKGLNADVQEVPGKQEDIIGIDVREDTSAAKPRGRTSSTRLTAAFGQPANGKYNINCGRGRRAGRISFATRSQNAGIAMTDQQAATIWPPTSSDYRTQHSGLIREPGRTAISTRRDSAGPERTQAADLSRHAGSRRHWSQVGPKIGAELQRKAILAVLYALGGMLVYIAFRFEWIYGAAAVIAVFHDTIITIGLFSLFNKEISLTVVAALLTLVGYSMNDTIVTFDRIRENLKILRREKLEPMINMSVNQTLSRTVLDLAG